MTAYPVEIIAHRGSSRVRKENTLAAFARAIAEGADGIELDVHATLDKVVVVRHDPDIPSNGSGSPNTIAALDLSALREQALPAGIEIPTLDEVLELVGTSATVYIEVKAVDIEEALVACLARHPNARVAVHAFDHRIPMMVRQLRSQTAIGLLNVSYPLDIAAVLQPASPADLWQHAQFIDAALVHAVHALGGRVIAWTENDPDHARHLVAIGVDALCTDTPGLLRAALVR